MERKKHGEKRNKTKSENIRKREREKAQSTLIPTLDEMISIHPNIPTGSSK